VQEGAEQQQEEEEPTARGGSAVRKNSPWVGRWDEPKAPSRIMSLPSLMVACHRSRRQQVTICREAVGSHQCTSRGTESLELAYSWPRREVCARRAARAPSASKRRQQCASPKSYYLSCSPLLATSTATLALSSLLMRACRMLPRFIAARKSTARTGAW
jgi:hypothetical protein